MTKDRDPMYPRDSAFSFTVPATKEGAITAMVPLSSHLEIYTEHETFKAQSPESIDPQRSNPNAMFVNAKIADVGSSSPIVARTILTANEMLNGRMVLDDAGRAEVLMRMHKIKNTLLQVDAACERFRSAFNAEVDRFQNTPQERGARALSYFPVIPDFEHLLTAFLIPARRVVTEICLIPNQFWKLRREHSGLQFLLEKELVPLLGDDHPLVQFLQPIAPVINQVVDFRNGQEHSSTTARKLMAKNFEMLPNNQVAEPAWHLEGDQPGSINADMPIMLGNLLTFAEGMFVACVQANLPEFPPMRLEFNENPPSQCPVRYQLGIDPSRFPWDQLPTEGGGSPPAEAK